MARERLGVVLDVIGRVTAGTQPGKERTLSPADVVYADETIVTATGAYVLIRLFDGTLLDLAGEGRAALADYALADADMAQADVGVKDVQALLRAGGDPTAPESGAEPTVAGPPGAEAQQGGHSFVVRLQDYLQVTPDAGIPTVADPLLYPAGVFETLPVEDANDLQNAGSAVVRVSEEGLVAANADAAGNTDTTNAKTVTGVFAIPGADGSALAVTLNAPSAALTSGGVPITWTGDGTPMLKGFAGGEQIVVITIGTNGAYKVALCGPVDHAVAGEEDVMSFDVTVNVSDGTLTSFGTLTVGVEDDSPVLHIVDGIVHNVSNATMAGDLVNFGADSVGTIDLRGNTPPAGLTSFGEAVHYEYSADGQTLYARSGDGDPVFTLTTNGATGNYIFTQHRALDLSVSQVLDLPFQFTATDADGDGVNGTWNVAVQSSATLTSGSDVHAMGGGTGAEILNGNGGGDFLYGGAGDDTLHGGGGGDVLHGGGGNDVLDGGDDIDTVSYSAISGPVTVDLVAGTAAGDGADTLSGIENIEGSAYADTLTGNSVSNLMIGGSGADVLVGGLDADIMRGGSGADILTGGLAGSTPSATDGATDRFVFTSLGEAGDIITDFDTALPASGGDVLDVADLLCGYQPGESDLGQFVLFETTATDTVVKVDVDGGGDNFQTVVTLQGVTGFNAEALAAAGNLVVLHEVP